MVLGQYIYTLKDSSSEKLALTSEFQPHGTCISANL